MSAADLRHILVCRHAKAVDGTAVAGQPPTAGIHDVGRVEVASVATAFAHFCEDRQRLEDGSVPVVGAVLLSPTQIVRETFSVLWSGFGSIRQGSYVRSDRTVDVTYPDELQIARRWELVDEPGSPRLVDFVLDWVSELDEQRVGQPTDPNAVLVVGHDPWMSDLAAALVERTRGKYRRLWPLPAPAPVALGRGELACVSFEARHKEGVANRRWARGRLAWTLMPSSDALEKDLREKIRSKFGVAAQLAALLSASLGFLLGNLADRDDVDAVGQTGVVLLLASLALLFGVMFAYDRLLMPKRYWSLRRSRRWLGQPSWLVERPPSSSTWILYQNMVRIWTGPFLLATALAVVGFALVASSALDVELWWVAVVAALTLLLILAWRPVVGSQD